MAVPYTFASATSTIPLSNLDSNFATPAIVGNTSVTLGTTVTTLGNVTLTNATLTSLSTALAVAYGGTGATTLTGYVKGNGTSALTASATVPSTDITGLGTMSTQNATAVAITGGTINGTTVGATTAAAGTFTTLTNTGTAYLGGASGNQSFQVNNVASGVNYLQAIGAVTTGQPTLSAQGTDTNIALNYIAKGSAYQFFYSANSPQFSIAPTASAVNYLQVTGGATGAAPALSAQGTDTDVSIVLTPKGAGNVGIGVTPAAWGSGWVAAQLGLGGAVVGRTANSSVYFTANTYFDGTNYKYINTDFASYYRQFSGNHYFYSASSGTAGTTVTFQSILELAQAGNLRIPNGQLEVSLLNNTSKGAVAPFLTDASNGGLVFKTESAGTLSERMRIGSTGTTSIGAAPGSESLRATPTASAVNYVNVIGAITTASPAIQAAGSDTNIDLVLTPKGTGVLSFGTYTAGIIAQAGYITIKDAGGTTRRLLVG